MSDKRISELTEATSIVQTDVFPVVNGGITKKVQIGTLLSLVSSSNFGNSQLDSVYNTVLANSAVNWNYQGDDLKALSANWDLAYTNLVSNSAAYLLSGSDVNLSFLSVSANWDSTYSTVASNSATWQTAYTNLVSNSATYLLSGVGGSADLSFLSVSANWDSTYNTVLANSATNWNYQGNDVRALSGNWQAAYTNLISNSAAYLTSVDISFLSVSANWNSTYNTVNANSAVNWNYQGDDLKALSGNWQLAYTNLISNSAAYLSGVDTAYLSTSANWNSVYNTVLANSAVNWNYQGNDVRALSSNWQAAYTNLVSNSAAYLTSVDISFLSVSANWNSTYNTVLANSAVNWNYQGTDLKALSSNWQNTYGSVNSLSANWQEAYTNLIANSATYLLSGAASVDLSFLSVSGNWNSVYNTVLANSATTWNYQGNDVRALSGNWQQAYTNLVSNSAAYLTSVDISFLSVSGNWNSVYNTVLANSATTWNYQGTDIKALTGNWQNTYGTVSALSSTWGTAQTVTVTVFNAEAVPLALGNVVYSFGAQGGTMSVKLASNVGDPTSSKTLGFVTGPIPVGSTGTVIIAGQLDKLNLGAYAEGDALWLDSTPGAFTNVKPTAPNHGVYLGVVERANNGNGLIYVKVQNGYELDELHDVLITSVSAGQVLRRNNANTVWQNVNDGFNWDSVYSTVQTLSTTWTTGFLPLSGGSIADGLTAINGTFTNSLSSPALSGMHYGDGSNLTGTRDVTKLPLSGGTLTGGLVGTTAIFNSVSASALSGMHYGDGSNLTGLTVNALDITKLPLSGGQLTGKLNLSAATTTAAGLNIGNVSQSPTTPVAGDVWMNGENMAFRGINAQRTLVSTSVGATFTAAIAFNSGATAAIGSAVTPALIVQQNGAAAGVTISTVSTTTNPALSVNQIGTGEAIKIASGVLKFPDGTTQSTAGTGGLTSTSAATYTVGATDFSIIFNAGCTVTLPTASSYTNRMLNVKCTSANAVNSASSNVVPLAGGAAGTSILAATAGKWAQLQSDGTNWIIMQAN